MTFWYLATPYAKYPGGAQAAFEEAVKNASLLVAAKIPIFCPIAHTHHIHPHINPADPHRFWLDFDRPFMEAAKGLIVVMMKTWEQSRGIEEEIQYFRGVGKPILHMLPGEVPAELKIQAMTTIGAIGLLPANPKQIFGDKKVPVHLVPSALILAAAQAFRDGATKYGPYNWRERSVEAETYIGAALRHIMSWHDGEDIDPESDLPHLGHAAACLAILLDATLVGNLIDNRPPKAPTGAKIRELAKHD